MKLRILENSIRIRLSQKEVSELVNGSSIVSKLEFPGHQHSFSYSIEINNLSQTQVSYSDHKIAIEIDHSTGLNWANSSEISIKKELYINEKSRLKLLIEKDFKCLTDRIDEDESDLFPNPNQDSIKC